MTRLRSLRARLTALAVVALAAVLALVGFALNRTLEDQLLQSVDRSLDQDLAEVLDGSVAGPRGFFPENRRNRRVGGRTPELAALAVSVASSRTAAVLYRADGEAVVTSASMVGVELTLDPDFLQSDGTDALSEGTTLAATYVGAPQDEDGNGLEVDALDPDALDGDTNITDDDVVNEAAETLDELRVRRLTLDGGQNLVVAQSLSSVDDALSGFRGRMVLGALPLLGLLGLLIWTFVGRALNPVETIRREVDEIDALGLERRVSVPTGSYELERLATTMNHMLDRVDASVAGQRRFVADASHELRSPLAGLRSTLEVNLAHPAEAEWTSAAESMHVDATRMQRLLEDLLALARSDDTTAPARREPVDLDDLVLGEAHQLRQQHSDLVVDLAGVSAAQVSADPEEIGRVARNLLENAARHAKTRIQVSVSEVDGRAVLEVADDGPGVPPHQADEIFKRFVRLDEARARSDGGSGLGLAIVSEIVDRHQGQVSVQPNLPHGARFIVELPTAL